MAKSDAKEEYPLCTNEDYLSYYVYQREWKPTRPIGPIGAMSSSPGPAIVNLPPTLGEKHHDITRPKAPSYRIGHRTFTDGKSSKIGPGPGAYDIRNLTNKGREPGKAPVFSKANRFSDRNTAIAASPGPAAYDRQTSDRSIYPRAPSFSMPHAQRSQAKSVTTPGPNSYSLPPIMGPGKTPYVVGASYSMGKAKRMRDAKMAQNPGPAAYLLPSTNVNMKKGPSYSMGSRAAPPTAGIHSPGPGAHAAHLVKYNKYSTPRITFGIRHSPYKALPGFAAEK